MDPRRLLTLAVAGLLLGGCAQLRVRLAETIAPSAAKPAPAASAALELPRTDAAAAPAAPSVPRPFATMAPIPDPPGRAEPRAAATAKPGPAPSAAAPGRAAIAAANVRARAPSETRAFVGGVQVFAYAPGRVYEVWAAPLRVTTLTLAPGESIVSKAAGDTERWQIGETTSGAGAGQRTHVMIKPLQRGLETNLVLATSQRIYLLQLRSGAPEAFNAAVAWDVGAVLADPPAAEPPPEPAETAASPAGPLDARFRISFRGRRPAWTPAAVMTDGVRTYLSFPPSLAATEAPALFAIGADGEPQLVNYRQHAGLWVVDRVLDAAELRLGDRRGQVVRIRRTGGAS